jgi:hypothetical protein
MAQETVSAAFGDRVTPAVYYFALPSAVEAQMAAPKLEAAFVADGLEADAIEQVAEDALGVQQTFNRLIEGFVGLG